MPTRERNQNGYLLLWEGEGLLFDPGEGTQRQMIHAGVSASRITRICLTHVHGDHCYGVPGVLSRMALDGVEHPVHLHYPASGEPVVRALVPQRRRLASAVLTAGQAGALAATGGVRTLRLTDFSSRYQDLETLRLQARARAGGAAVRVARDLDRIRMPGRRTRLRR